MLSIEKIKNIVCPLAKKYEVDRVYLFGSYARGEATEKSDVDLCIDPGKLDGLEFCGFYVEIVVSRGKAFNYIESADS